MLNDFFRINMPYGIAKNDFGEWMCFNREYMPLGYKDEAFKGYPGKSFSDIPVYTKFNGLSDKFISKIATSVVKNEKGEIERVFLYDDATNPVSNYLNKKNLWDIYFNKIKLLSKLKKNDPYADHIKNKLRA